MQICQSDAILILRAFTIVYNESFLSETELEFMRKILIQFPKLNNATLDIIAWN